MPAIFGMPGHIELLIIGMICLMMVAVPAVVIAIVLLINRRKLRDD